MIDVNPNWSAFFYDLIGNIMRMIYSIGETCAEAFYVLQTHTVRQVMEEYFDDTLLGEILNFFLEIFISDWFLDLQLWEFLMFGGIVVAVIINLIKVIR